ncbi:MAG: sugar phosphate nucleotidyltransferase [Limnohabitans sp.]|nr:sugar phosphate nucleotidyltransferase [Limnohabitans sp.]
MISVVLAAGIGERLRPFTETYPKPLLRFNDVSILEMTLRALPLCNKIIVVVDYLGDQIIEELNKFNLSNIEIVWQNKNYKGTMGAVLSAMNLIDDNFLVICADNIYFKEDLIRLTEKTNTFLALNISKSEKKVKYPFAKYSVFPQASNSENVILDAGAWFLEKRFIEAKPFKIENGKEIGVPHTMKFLSDTEGVSYEAIFTQKWLPIGNLEEVLIAEKQLKMKSNIKKR